MTNIRYAYAFIPLGPALSPFGSSVVSIYTNLGQNSVQAVESEQKSLRVGYCSEELELCQGGRTGELLTQGIRLSCCRGSRGDRRV